MSVVSRHHVRELASPEEEVMLARLKEPLDGYHQRRADKHGFLYIIQNEAPRTYANRYKRIYEARSITTGVVCTFRAECVEFVDDAT